MSGEHVGTSRAGPGPTGDVSQVSSRTGWMLVWDNKAGPQGRLLSTVTVLWHAVLLSGFQVTSFIIVKFSKS